MPKQANETQQAAPGEAVELRRIIERARKRLGGNGRAHPNDVGWAREILAEADAVPAVNAHAELVAALRDAAANVEWIAARLSDPAPDEIAHSAVQLRRNANAMRAALAKVQS